MPRADRSDERRAALLPVLGDAFAELGYRRATTAELARRCEVQETTLYRLWPDKRSMFVAVLDLVYLRSREAWGELCAQDPGNGSTVAERILAYESEHHGESGLYRIVFAGLSEADDAEIAAALRRLYGRFHQFVREQVELHRGSSPGAEVDPALAAWAILGLGTVANIGRELGLVSARARQRLLLEAGRALLGPRSI